MSRVVPPASVLLPRRKQRIDEVVARRVQGLTLVLENIHDPHNLAAILRTVEGLGLQDVHVLEAPSGFRPSASVTQGADKWLTLHRHRSLGACVDALRQSGHRLVGSMLTGEAVDVAALPVAEKLALAFGNEHAGLSAELAAQCAGFFRIPMDGFSQSFNVSVAIGIALGTALHERRRAGLGGDLSEQSQAELRERFYALSADLP